MGQGKQRQPPIAVSAVHCSPVVVRQWLRVANPLDQFKEVTFYKSEGPQRSAA
jgi:hypothetical protein